MRMKRTLMMTLALTVVALSATLGVFQQIQPVKATPETTMAHCPSFIPPPPDYTVPPGNTDGDPGDDDGSNQPDCLEPGEGIGCEDRWGDLANNEPHLFYLPPSNQPGKLLVFLNGGKGRPNPELPIYTFAASRGYHVIGLNYFGSGEVVTINGCGKDSAELSCYEDFMSEVIFGDHDCVHETCSGLNIDKHRQDAALNRLLRALEWARSKHAADGWDQYLTPEGKIDWTQINIAGFSNGSSFAALIGKLLPVGRVSLFAGPNDGKGNSDKWKPAYYIERVTGITDTRYYGLVDELNKAADDGNTSTLYKVTEAWRTLGMGEPNNASRLFFHPAETPTFGSAHMLISRDVTTHYREAHEMVVHGRKCTRFEQLNNGNWNCKEWNGDWIGYEPAWRCVLGSGNELQNGNPTADAGQDQTLECAGDGGAFVMLDGSTSSDPDCDVLTYTWTGPFGVVSGRKPKVFLPVGTNFVTLTVTDARLLSTSSDTTTITVQDTQPPSLQLTLTPTNLWSANHQLIRINATVNASDSCGPPPTVVLTSITSNQPDNGAGDGDMPGDIQEAEFGTFDLSFLLRAERAGNDPRGRTYTITYTATDASGNCTQAFATVHVPHSRP